MCKIAFSLPFVSGVTEAHIQHDSRTQRTVKASPAVMPRLCQFQSDRPVLVKVSCTTAFVFVCAFLVLSVRYSANVSERDSGLSKLWHSG